MSFWFNFFKNMSYVTVFVNDECCDGGIRGVVIAPLNALKLLEMHADGSIYAETGVTCAKLAKFCQKSGLVGGDFLAGIPALASTFWPGIDGPFPDYHLELPENEAPYGRSIVPKRADGRAGDGSDLIRMFRGAAERQGISVHMRHAARNTCAIAEKNSSTATAAW